MTTTATARAITPDPADIADFRRQLAERESHAYAYAAGYLISLITGIAAEHRCRKPGCMTCNRLSRGLALIAAIDARDADQAGGAS